MTQEEKQKRILEVEASENDVLIEQYSLTDDPQVERQDS